MSSTTADSARLHAITTATKGELLMLNTHYQALDTKYETASEREKELLGEIKTLMGNMAKLQTELNSIHAAVAAAAHGGEGDPTANGDGSNLLIDPSLSALSAPGGGRLVPRGWMGLHRGNSPAWSRPMIQPATWQGQPLSPNVIWRRADTESVPGVTFEGVGNERKWNQQSTWRNADGNKIIPSEVSTTHKAIQSAVKELLDMAGHDPAKLHWAHLEIEHKDELDRLLDTVEELAPHLALCDGTRWKALTAIERSLTTKRNTLRKSAKRRAEETGEETPESQPVKRGRPSHAAHQIQARRNSEIVRAQRLQRTLQDHPHDSGSDHQQEVQEQQADQNGVVGEPDIPAYMVHGADIGVDPNLGL